jgi:hypothetical protein
MTSAAALLLWLTGFQAGGPGTGREPIVVVLLTSNPDGRIVRGATLGAEEMTRTASLLGREFTLRVQPITPAGSTSSINSQSDPKRAVVVLLDVEEAQACDMARSTPHLVVTTRVVSRPCHAPWLQVRLPLQERVRILAHASEPGLRVDEWHSTLTRYGAGELNERYRRRMNADMDGDAWTGWFATKAVTEAVLRLGSANRETLAAAHSQGFDGHKGVRLRFGPDGILRQPVYLVQEVEGRASQVLKEIR